MKFVVNTVQLFITCIIDALYPEIGEAVVRVLRRAGVSVEFQPDQTCCGQPAFNAGMRTQARQMAEHTIKTFEKAPGVVVLPSGSCTAMIRHGYGELFDGDPVWSPRAKRLAERTFEFTEFLVDKLGKVDLGAVWEGRLTYHASCHLLRDLGVKRQPHLLLGAVKGVELVDLPKAEECCGFGGVFSVEHPEISAEMLDRKIAEIRNSKAPVVVACDAGCLTHINGGLHRRGMKQRALHIAEILDQREP
jgi:L-lactate dehydrogenase complex protein LldE